MKPGRPPSRHVPGAVRPAGLSLIPTYLYSFRAEIPGFVEGTPAPESASLLLLGGGLVAAGALRRRVGESGFRPTGDTLVAGRPE